MNTTQASKQDNEGENGHINLGISITPDQYMEHRVIYKFKLYKRLGDKQKWLYWMTSLVGIILAASVPVLINLNVTDIIPTILSLIVTILVSVEKLFHFREHWRNYDEIAAFLRSEQLKFQTGAGQYTEKDKDPDKTFQKFISRIERAISEERSETIDMRTSEIVGT